MATEKIKTGNSLWLGLMIGNSRLHWGWFDGDRLGGTWETPHLTAAQIHRAITPPFDLATLGLTAATMPLPQNSLPFVAIASVVPSQTALWQGYPSKQILTLADVPLQGLYATMGLDRALALWAAAETIGSPVLMIDGGTALTITGLTPSRCLAGGAILPGLGLQYRALGQGTAMDLDSDLARPSPSRPWPDRWAMTTPGAIRSGVVYTVLAGLGGFIADWHGQYPTSPIVLTGGDAVWLLSGLQHQAPSLRPSLHHDPHLGLRGIALVTRA